MPDFHGPGLIERLTQQLASQKGVKDPTAMALALLKARGQVDEDGRLTTAGKARDKLGAAGRAKDRAAKAGGHKPEDLKYDKGSNRAVLKARKPWGR